MMWGDGWGWGMGWPMFFGGLVPLLLFALCAYLLVQALNRGGQATPPGSAGPVPPVPPRRETALETAQRRYAAGEISREDFVRIRDDIGHNSTGIAPSA